MTTQDMGVRPDIFLLEDLVGEVARGRFRVPKFQRPFVWRPDQMCDLFDSIENGYPIGTVLIWETAEAHSSVDHIGPVQVATEMDPTGFILDGHQRLSTLVGCLRATAAERETDWRWSIFRDLEADSGAVYSHWRRGGQPPVQLFPLSAVLRTMDFLQWARGVASRTENAERADALIYRAEEIASAFKSYKIPVTRLVGGGLDRAVEVFSRLNSTGSSMSPEQMVSALTFESSGKESLGERIAGIQERVDATGWGFVDATTIFRVVMIAAGESNVLAARWGLLAARLSGKIEVACVRAEEAIGRALGHLSELGVAHQRLLPYQMQFVLLCAAHLSSDALPAAVKEGLAKWFWATSWSGWFAGMNTTQVREAVDQMLEYVASAGAAGLPTEGMQPRPFPERFDMRSARVRTHLIVDFMARPVRAGVDGSEIRVADVLSDVSIPYRHVVGEGIGPLGSSPANRVVLPTGLGVSVRRVISAHADEPEWLRTHGIPVDAASSLRDGDDAGFVRIRREFLLDEERRFMAQYDLSTSFGASEDAVDE